MSMFRPAVKEQLKARLALDGPTGSGKTWTALSMATELAQGGGIAVVDTERDSARKYAHRFAFDVAALAPPYEVERLVETLAQAQEDRYSVVVVDSLSHFWVGEGGVLDAVDAAAARAHGNKFAGWLHGTPLQRYLVDSILALDLHVIVTMRSKMEYVLEDVNGKQVPRKIGLQPVQREGLEYEFDVIGDLDLDHRITITKSRCDTLADTVVQPHREREAAKTFLEWLNDGEPRASRDDLAVITTALKQLDIELLDRVKDEIKATWGPPNELLANSVGEILDHIEAARDAAAPFAAEAHPPDLPEGEARPAPPTNEAASTEAGSLSDGQASQPRLLRQDQTSLGDGVKTEKVKGERV